MSPAQIKARLAQVWGPAPWAKERASNVAQGLEMAYSWSGADQYLRESLRVLEREDYVERYGPAPSRVEQTRLVQLGLRTLRAWGLEFPFGPWQKIGP